MKAVSFCGAAVDISKFFDQVVRALVYGLARLAGMPERVLGAYERFQEGIEGLKLHVRREVSKDHALHHWQIYASVCIHHLGRC